MSAVPIHIPSASGRLYSRGQASRGGDPRMEPDVPDPLPSGHPVPATGGPSRRGLALSLCEPPPPLGYEQRARLSKQDVVSWKRDFRRSRSLACTRLASGRRLTSEARGARSRIGTGG